MPPMLTPSSFLMTLEALSLVRPIFHGLQSLLLGCLQANEDSKRVLSLLLGLLSCSLALHILLLADVEMRT